MNDAPAATLADATDQAGTALSWLSATFKGVSLNRGEIIVPRFGGIEARVRIPDADSEEAVEVSATVVVANREHPLLPLIVAEGRRIFGSEIVVVSAGSESEVSLRRKVPRALATEALLLETVAEVGTASAYLHKELLPILSPTAGR